MFAQIVKTAKNIIAKNEAKKLLEYFKNEATNGLTNDQIQLIKQKIVTIQKQSFNFPWFVHRFIIQRKHYQDIDDLLKLTKAYKKLNKQLRTFQFDDNKSFSKFQQFMNKYMKSNINNQQFIKPTYCPLIYSDSKYNYYYADAKDQKCFQQLHSCNTKADGKQYAMWCVVTGTVSWGRYTDAEFPFYVYVTNKKNIPFMLFNFGYDQDAQIKDIHDNEFTKYDNQIAESILAIAKKYNFDISESYGDFQLLGKIVSYNDESFILRSLQYNPKIKNEKYSCYDYDNQIIIDHKKKQLAYIIHNEEECLTFNNHDFNDQLFWDIMIKSNVSRKNLALFILEKNNVKSEIIDIVVNWFLEQNSYNHLHLLINRAKKVTRITKQQLEIALENMSYKSIAILVKNNLINIIENPMLLDLFTKQKEAVQGLTILIESDIIKWNDNLLQLYLRSNKLLQLKVLIVNKYIKFNDKILNELLKTKDSAVVLGDILMSDRFINGNEKIIQFLVKNKFYDKLIEIYQKHQLISDSKLLQNIFVKNKDDENLKRLIYNKNVKLYNETLDYLMNGDKISILDSIMTFTGMQCIEDQDYFINIAIKQKQCNLLLNCIIDFNLKLTDDVIDLFIVNKKQGAIAELVKKNKIENITDDIIKKIKDNNLYNLFSKLVIDREIEANKQNIDYIQQNIDHLSTYMKFAINQFIRSNQLDY